MAEPLNLRRAVRAVLLDPDDRVLLARFCLPGIDVWGAPGGGIEDAEDPRAALGRELLEETGLDLEAAGLDPGAQVAHRVHVFEIGNGYHGQEEWYYLLRVPPFEPRGRLTDEQLRAESLHGLRWWSVPELQDRFGSGGDRREVCAPRNLPEVLAGWLADGSPRSVVELDV